MIWLTEIKKPDPLTGEIKSWCGPRIEADSWEEAEFKILKVKHCHILGVLVKEIDYEPIEPTWLN
jgi:hypothetical protein